MSRRWQIVKDNRNALPLFEVSQLTVNYDKTPVLWDISLTVPKGVMVGIVGPNGAGKSTLIKAAMGIVKPLTGKVEFFGQPLKRVRQRVAYVPQRESVDWNFPITVKELVLMGRYGKLGLFKWPKKEDRQKAAHYLKLVGMEEYGDRQISQLSGGQQQRAFLARALMQEADLYFLDEPFAGVDLATEGVIIDLLRKLRDQGKTIFVVHHDLNSVESYFDWVLLLNMRLVACGETSRYFTPHYLNSLYGKSYALLGEAFKLSQQKQSGLGRG
jgi:manganese/zinc/iron transport system ATP- binding protein